MSRNVIFWPFRLYTVSTDVLGDTACLTFDDVGFADVVQQRSLTVIDVSHDGYDRRSRHEVFLAVLFVVADGFLDVRRYEFGLEAELFGYDHERLGVETLVDRHHQAQVHAGRDDLGRRNVHHRSQLGYGHEFGDLQDGAFLLFALEFFVHALGYGFAFFLAVFRTFALGVFRRQAGQCIFHLLRNLLVADFGTNDGLRSFEFVLAGLLVLSRTGLVGLRALSAAGLCGGFTVAARLGAACRRTGHVHFLFTQAFAFVAVARCESRYVHRAEYLRAREGLHGGAEDVVALGRRFRFGFGCGSRFGGRCRFRFGGGRLRCRLRFRSRSLRYGLCRRFAYRFRSRFGLGRKIYFAQNFGLGQFVLDADDVAFDNYLLLLFARLFLCLFEGDRSLLLGDSLPDAFPFVAGNSAPAEFLLQNGIDVRFHQRIGRTVGFYTLLLQEVRDGIQSHLELLGNLDKS